MGLMDNLKAKLGPAKDKVSDLAQQHGGKIQHGIDRAAKVVDEKTKGKYSDRIQTGSGKAKDAMDRLAHKGGAAADGGAATGPATPPTPPPASPPQGPPPAS
ncbi:MULTISPECIES: antitoxin [unclassified Streptomyces]|uniref:antitoxin n=1 Tax=unclassified Streptomyces TaxID=2593676 RepID=UPI0034526608